MTVNHREMLSALMDGQLSGDALTEAIELISNDADVKADYLRWQHTRDVMHGYTRGLKQRPVDLTLRLSAQLANEPVYSQSERRHQSNIIRFPAKVWKQAAGLAVAASVGALAVVGVMQPSIQTGFQSMPVAAVESAPQTASTSPVVRVNRWIVEAPEVEDRLNHYLVDHNEYAGGAGMFSYGRVVSYGAEQ
ncbi:Anti sigma-E protein RseA [Methylophaga frappieri]|uniref:Anti sigma-E protein RseA n=1 Tax=Methylophaga frappieri (strain ATCC BAA-2434 / DSM 25690 / JAM7) TaxID=754477 RepID=I1YFB0_METFJ|nr:RseA family anti-sigma factor [Methylophaga frappieri]AFJ01603.1 Anti sigma-E protein RseA [Methylophaga frappieri]